MSARAVQTRSASTDLFGYDKKAEPGIDQLDNTGFSPAYVYRETKRSVPTADGKAKAYPSIRLDAPS